MIAAIADNQRVLLMNVCFMASELLELRRYLETVMAETGGLDNNGNTNITGWFRLHRFEENGIMPRTTFGNLFSKESLPKIDTIIKIAAVVSKARSSISKPPIKPKDIALKIPSLAPLVEALNSTDGLPSVDKSPKLSDDLRADQAIATIESLPLVNRIEIVPKLLEICAEAVAMKELHGIKKIQWIFCEIQRRRSKGWPDFYEYYFSNRDLPYKAMEEIARGEFPSSTLNAKAIAAIEGFLNEVEGRTLLKFDAEDLDCLKRSRKK